MTQEDFTTLENMKVADKAKAFDMIVATARNNDNINSEIKNILDWCAKWFGD